MKPDYIDVAFRRNMPEKLYAFVEKLEDICAPLRINGFKNNTNPGHYVLSVPPNTPRHAITYQQVKQISDAFEAFYTRPSVGKAGALLSHLEYIGGMVSEEDLQKNDSDRIVLSPDSGLSLALKSEFNRRNMDAQTFTALQNSIIEGYILLSKLPVTQFFQKAVPQELIEELLPPEEIPYYEEDDDPVVIRLDPDQAAASEIEVDLGNDDFDQAMPTGVA